jgi:RNA polymerase II subunit A-like phosphatase
MPEEYEEGKSPVDNLQTFDWGGVDDELAEFMDGESDSDAGSDTGSETSQRSARSGDKRKYSANEDADEQDSDEESTLAKKQRIANNRTTGLKTVKTPNSEASSLPTPGDTVDGEQNKPSSQEDDDDVDFDDELERELMEELERGDAEDEAVAIANGEADVGG